MVSLQENQIVITIATPSPAETLAELQTGIIEMVKTLLSMGSEGSDLELDRDTANGGYCALQLLQATLFDPATIEAAQDLATAIQSRANTND
jgi:hypothetical protein